MITTEKVKKTSERLEALRRLTLEKYLDEIDDLNSEILLYDVMIHHLAKGDFLDDYQFSSLEGLNNNEQKEIMELVDKYCYLCFHDGNVDYWSDSTESIKDMDYEMVTTKILDNYEFLIFLAKDGGEEALEELSKLKDSIYYEDTSVIEVLRNTFTNDEILSKTILNMTAKNNLFKVFTDYQKATLLSYPEGVLYFFDKDNVKIVSPLFLAKEICNRFFGEDFTDKNDIENLALVVTEKLREIDEDNFYDIIFEMSDDYIINNIKDYFPSSLEDLPVINDDGAFSSKVWSIK